MTDDLLLLLPDLWVHCKNEKSGSCQRRDAVKPFFGSNTLHLMQIVKNIFISVLLHCFVLSEYRKLVMRYCLFFSVVSILEWLYLFLHFSEVFPHQRFYRAVLLTSVNFLLLFFKNSLRNFFFNSITYISIDIFHLRFTLIYLAVPKAQQSNMGL